MEKDQKGVRLGYSRERIYLLIGYLRDPQHNGFVRKKKAQKEILQVMLKAIFGYQTAPQT